MDDTKLTLLKMALDFISPVALALIALRTEFNHKKSVKLQELEAEKKANEQKEIKENFEKLNKRFDKIDDSLDDMRKTMDGFKTKLTSHEKEIKKIEKMNRLNGQYTHELAVLVMALSEGIRDNHLDGNITRAIEKYRAFEANTLGHIITGDTDVVSAE